MCGPRCHSGSSLYIYRVYLPEILKRPLSSIPVLSSSSLRRSFVVGSGESSILSSLVCTDHFETGTVIFGFVREPVQAQCAYFGDRRCRELTAALQPRTVVFEAVVAAAGMAALQPQGLLFTGGAADDPPEPPCIHPHGHDVEEFQCKQELLADHLGSAREAQQQVLLHRHPTSRLASY